MASVWSRMHSRPADPVSDPGAGRGSRLGLARGIDDTLILRWLWSRAFKFEVAASWCHQERPKALPDRLIIFASESRVILPTGSQSAQKPTLVWRSIKSDTEQQNITNVHESPYCARSNKRLQKGPQRSSSKNAGGFAICKSLKTGDHEEWSAPSRRLSNFSASRSIKDRKPSANEIRCTQLFICP
jgi:hypothetical protein